MPQTDSGAPHPGPRASGLPSAALVLATTLLINAPCLFYPLARDQGIFAYNTAALLDGATPYLDFVDQKPPGILFIYAIPLLLFGRSMWGIHLFEWIVIGVTSLLVQRLASRLAGELAGLAGGLLTGFLLGPSLYDFWDRAQVESFLTLPYAAILLLFTGEEEARGWKRLALAGAMGGGCFCLKPNAAAFPLLAAAVHLWFGWREAAPPRLGRLLAGLACFAVFFSALPVVMLGWLQAKGAWQAFIEHVLAVNTPYVGAGFRATLLGFSIGIAPAMGLGGAVLLVFFFAARRAFRKFFETVWVGLGPPARRAERLALLAALWIGCVVTFISGRFLFSYHQQVLVFPNALTLALFVPGFRVLAGDRLAGWFDSTWIGRPVFPGSLAALALVLGTVLTLRPEDRTLLSGKLSLVEYQGSPRFDFFDFSFSQDRALARAVADFTRPPESVQIFGHGSLALFLARRSSATRFSYTSAAMDPRYGRGGKDREEILERLRQEPPPLVVIRTNDALPRFDVASSERQVLEFAPLASFLRESYRGAGRIGDYILLRRRVMPPVQPSVRLSTVRARAVPQAPQDA